MYIFDGYAGVRFPSRPVETQKSLIEHRSGTPSTGLKSELFVREHIMPFSWCVISCYLERQLEN